VHWSETVILMLLLHSCFTVYVFTMRSLTVISNFISDLSFKSDRRTLIMMCCNSDSTIWWIFCIITLTYVWFNELCLSWMFSLIWFIKSSLTIRLFSFFFILESCFWAEFFFWLTCIQRVCICWVNFTMLFWCFFFFLSFERSPTILLSSSIRVCHLASVNFLMICCFFLFCCWDLSVIDDLTEFSCLFCAALTLTVQSVIKMTADE